VPKEKGATPLASISHRKTFPKVMPNPLGKDDWSLLDLFQVL